MLQTVKTWTDAERAVREIAGNLPIYWGSGNTIDRPHVVAMSKDAWSGEGMGYNVMVYPLGGGYMQPCAYHSVNVEFST